MPIWLASSASTTARVDRLLCEAGALGAPCEPKSSCGGSLGPAACIRATSSISMAPSTSVMPAPHAAETIGDLRRRGSRIVYVTNKPLETADDYAAKLSSLGVATSRSDVVTSVDALVDYLRARAPGHDAARGC